MGHDGQNEFTKLPSGTIEKVKISIPIKEDGGFDLEAQQEIANKYRKIQKINDGIEKEKQYVLFLQMGYSLFKSEVILNN